MKFRLFFLSIFVAYFCNAQKDTSSNLTTTTISIDTTLSSYILKDSCWNEPHIDTIQVDFVIIVDANNFVKKERAPFIVDKYDIKNCRYSSNGLYYNPKQNEIFLLNGKPTEVLLYQRKGDVYGSLQVGNSQ